MSSLSCGTLYSTIVSFALYIYLYVFCIPTLRVFGSGGSAGGSDPFSFRTRQSSLLAAMVLIVSDGESS